MPVPVSDSSVVADWTLLANVREAETAPVVCGLNVTVNEALCPAGIVTGSERPPTLNTELLPRTLVTVTFAPEAVSFPVPLVPTTTFPTPSVAGVTVNCPFVAEPVPDSTMLNEGFAASEVMVTLPLALPADFGANNTLNATLCPALGFRFRTSRTRKTDSS